MNEVSRRIAKAAPAEFVATNTSVNGNTTRMALERMPHDVQAHGVDILLVQFGMDDCNFWQTDGGVPRESPVAFEANLAERVERGRGFCASRVFMNINHPTPPEVGRKFRAFHFPPHEPAYILGGDARHYVSPVWGEGDS